MKPYLLQETNYKAVKDEHFDLAILPWGATEAHNYHLPYGTDIYESISFASGAAELAWEKGVKCLVLPTIPFGVNTGQSDLPGTMNIYPSTQALILNDILESVRNSGIRKLLILNSHGGNDFRQILREAGRDFDDMFLVTSNWFQSLDKSRFFTNSGDHADEMETCLMLHLYPELVLPLSEAGSGKAKTFNSKTLNEPWAWSERMWTKVSEDTGIGDPREATAEKGKIYYKAVCEKLVMLIKEIAELDPEDPYK